MWFRLRTEHDVPSYCCLHVSYVRTLLLLPCLNYTTVSMFHMVEHYIFCSTMYLYTLVWVVTPCFSSYCQYIMGVSNSTSALSSLSVEVIPILVQMSVFVWFSFRFLRCSHFPSIIYSAPFWVIAFQWPQFSSLSLRKLFNIHWHIRVLIYSSSTFFSSFLTKV